MTPQELVHYLSKSRQESGTKQGLRETAMDPEQHRRHLEKQEQIQKHKQTQIDRAKDQVVVDSRSPR